MQNGALPDWVVYVVTALGGGAGYKLLDWLNARRKMRLDSDAALQDAIDRRVRMILEDDEKTIRRLTEEQAESAERISAMEDYITILVDALRAANIAIPRRPEVIRARH